MGQSVGEKPEMVNISSFMDFKFSWEFSSFFSSYFLKKNHSQKQKEKVQISLFTSDASIYSPPGYPFLD